MRRQSGAALPYAVAAGYRQLVVCDGGSPPEQRGVSRAMANVDGGRRGAQAPEWEKGRSRASRGLPARVGRRNHRSDEMFTGRIFVVVDRAYLDHEITMKYYFNDYLIPKLKDIIKILLFNGNKIFWEDFPRF